jgi:glutamine synthetase
MASLADLINLDLSDTTDKIIVEYLWLASSSAFHLLPILTEKKPAKDSRLHSHAKLYYSHSK